MIPEKWMRKCQVKKLNPFSYDSQISAHFRLPDSLAANI